MNCHDPRMLGLYNNDNNIQEGGELGYLKIWLNFENLFNEKWDFSANEDYWNPWNNKWNKEHKQRRDTTIYSGSAYTKPNPLP